jgi:hypothetical protein
MVTKETNMGTYEPKGSELRAREIPIQPTDPRTNYIVQMRYNGEVKHMPRSDVKKVMKGR